MAALSQNKMTPADIAAALALQKKAAAQMAAKPLPYQTAALPGATVPTGYKSPVAAAPRSSVVQYAQVVKPAVIAAPVAAAKPAVVAAKPPAAVAPVAAAPPLVSEADKARLYALEASMQAAAATSADVPQAVSPAPVNVTAPQPGAAAPVNMPPPMNTTAQAPITSTVVADTQRAQDNVISQMTTLLTEQAATRQKLVDAVKKVSSPENYQEMLDAALKTMMPQFEARKKELATAYQELGRKMDINQEQRGVYSSNFAADQYRQQQDKQATDIASQLADTQANAAGQANQTIAQQLQSLGMQGDWQSSDASLGMGALNTQAGMANAMGQLGLDAQGQQIQQSQWGQEFNQQGAQFDKTYGLEQSKLAQDQSQFGQTLDFNKQGQQIQQDQFGQELTQKGEQFNKTYTLEEAKLAQDQGQFDKTMAFDETQLKQAADQWAKEFVQKGEFHQDELDQFTKTMGLQWAQLGAQQAASAASAASAAAGRSLDWAQFSSEQKRQDAYDAQDNLEYSANVMNNLYQGYMSDPATDDATKKKNMGVYASLYKSDPKLYGQMTSVINNTFTAAPAAVTAPKGVSAKTYNPYTSPVSSGKIDSRGIMSDVFGAILGTKR